MNFSNVFTNIKPVNDNFWAFLAFFGSLNKSESSYIFKGPATKKFMILFVIIGAPSPKLLDYVKGVKNLNLSKLDPKKIVGFVCKCLFMCHFILESFPQMSEY